MILTKHLRKPCNNFIIDKSFDDFALERGCCKSGGAASLQFRENTFTLSGAEMLRRFKKGKVKKV